MADLNINLSVKNVSLAIDRPIVLRFRDRPAFYGFCNTKKLLLQPGIWEAVKNLQNRGFLLPADFSTGLKGANGYVSLDSFGRYLIRLIGGADFD